MEENATDLSIAIDPFYGDPDMFVSLKDPDGLSMPTQQNFTWQGLSFGGDTLHMQVRHPGGAGGGRCTNFMHSRNRMTIDPIPYVFLRWRSWYAWAMELFIGFHFLVSLREFFHTSYRSYR